MVAYAHAEVLVDTDWVKAHLGQPELKLVEVDLDTKAYEAGHIPGAVAFNWLSQLQDPTRRDVVGPKDFEKLLSGAGISAEDTVVFYGDNSNWFAAFGFWLFKYYGHRDVRLMDGGRGKWLTESDKPVTTQETPIPSARYQIARCHQPLRVLVAEVLEAVERRSCNVLDVRTSDEFTGKITAPVGITETAHRGGHVPGAISVPWRQAVQSDGTIRPAAELRDIYLNQKSLDPAKPTIVYGRIGERCSHSWFVLKYLLGLADVRNYDGGWTEYGNMIGLPIERSA